MFSYTFTTHRFPHPVTVDSGAATMQDAFDDIRGYVIQAHGKEYAPQKLAQITDHAAPTKH